MAGRGVNHEAGVPEPEVRRYLRAVVHGVDNAERKDRARFLLGELRRGTMRPIQTKLHVPTDGSTHEGRAVSLHYAMRIGERWYSHNQVRALLREAMERAETPYRSYALRMCLYEDSVNSVMFWLATEPLLELHGRIERLAPIGEASPESAV